MLLREGSGADEHLEAYIQASVLRRAVQASEGGETSAVLLAQSRETTRARFHDARAQLERAGWQCDRLLLRGVDDRHSWGSE